MNCLFYSSATTAGPTLTVMRRASRREEGGAAVGWPPFRPRARARGRGCTLVAAPVGPKPNPPPRPPGERHSGSRLNLTGFFVSRSILGNFLGMAMKHPLFNEGPMKDPLSQLKKGPSLGARTARRKQQERDEPTHNQFGKPAKFKPGQL